MQRRASVGAQADHVASIGRYFRMQQDDVEHPRIMPAPLDGQLAGNGHTTASGGVWQLTVVSLSDASVWLVAATGAPTSMAPSTNTQTRLQVTARLRSIIDSSFMVVSCGWPRRAAR
jgi:hypothetical protein